MQLLSHALRRPCSKYSGHIPLRSCRVAMKRLNSESAPIRRRTETRYLDITRAFVAALLMACFAGTATAEGLDRKTMLQLLPCKSAALRLCDRSQGISVAALWRCAATLVEHQHEVGRRCVTALKSYGRL